MHKSRLTGSRRKAAIQAALNPKLGWRTGKDIKAGKNIRVVNGHEVFDDYFTDSESDASIFDGTDSPVKTAPKRRSSRKESVFKEPTLSAKQTNTKSAVSEDRPSGRKTRGRNQSEDDSAIVKQAQQPTGPPLNRGGDPLGSISKTDVVSAKPNLAEPNSALTNFRTRKRLTYSEAERLSMESAHAMLPPPTRRSSKLHAVNTSRSQPTAHTEKASAEKSFTPKISDNQRESPRKHAERSQTRSSVGSPARTSRRSEKPASPPASPARVISIKRDTPTSIQSPGTRRSSVGSPSRVSRVETQSSSPGHSMSRSMSHSSHLETSTTSHNDTSRRQSRSRSATSTTTRSQHSPVNSPRSKDASITRVDSPVRLSRSRTKPTSPNHSTGKPSRSTTLASPAHETSPVVSPRLSSRKESARASSSSPVARRSLPSSAQSEPESSDSESEEEHETSADLSPRRSSRSASREENQSQSRTRRSQSTGNDTPSSTLSSHQTRHSSSPSTSLSSSQRQSRNQSSHLSSPKQTSFIGISRHASPSPGKTENQKRKQSVSPLSFYSRKSRSTSQETSISSTRKSRVSSSSPSPKRSSSDSGSPNNSKSKHSSPRKSTVLIPRASASKEPMRASPSSTARSRSMSSRAQSSPLRSLSASMSEEYQSSSPALSRSRPQIRKFSLTAQEPVEEKGQKNASRISRKSATEKASSSSEQSRSPSPRKGQKDSGDASTKSTTPSKVHSRRSALDRGGSDHAASHRVRSPVRQAAGSRNASPFRLLDMDVNAPWSLHFDGDSPARSRKVPGSPAGAKRKSQMTEASPNTPKKLPRLAAHATKPSSAKDSSKAGGRRTRHASAPMQKAELPSRRKRRATAGSDAATKASKAMLVAQAEASPVKRSRKSIKDGSASGDQQQKSKKKQRDSITSSKSQPKDKLKVRKTRSAAITVDSDSDVPSENESKKKSKSKKVESTVDEVVSDDVVSASDNESERDSIISSEKKKSKQKQRESTISSNSQPKDEARVRKTKSAAVNVDSDSDVPGKNESEKKSKSKKVKSTIVDVESDDGVSASANDSERDSIISSDSQPKDKVRVRKTKSAAVDVDSDSDIPSKNESKKKSKLKKVKSPLVDVESDDVVPASDNESEDRFVGLHFTKRLSQGSKKVVKSTSEDESSAEKTNLKQKKKHKADVSKKKGVTQTKAKGGQVNRAKKSVKYDKKSKKKSKRQQREENASESEENVAQESPKYPVTIGSSDEENVNVGSPRRKSVSKQASDIEADQAVQSGRVVRGIKRSSMDGSGRQRVSSRSSDDGDQISSGQRRASHSPESSGALHPVMIEFDGDVDGPDSVAAESSNNSNPLVSRGHLPLLSFVMMEDDEELEKAVELSQKTGDTSLLEEGLKKGRESDFTDVSTPVPAAQRKSVVAFAASPIGTHPGGRKSILKNRARLAATPGGISMTASPVHFMQTTVSAPTPRPTPRPKVHIISPDPAPDGLRRSQRTRVPPLRRHVGERIKYVPRKSGGWVIGGVISPLVDKYEEEEKMKKLKKPVGRRKNKGVFPRRNMSMHQPAMSDDNEVTDTGAVAVVDPINNEEVYVDCIRTRDSLRFRGPHGGAAVAEDNLILARAINQTPFSAGTLIIRGLQEKRTQCAGKDAVVFSIAIGKVEVSIHRTTSILESGDFFFVPPENTYNIRNLRNDDAELVFFRLKG